MKRRGFNGIYGTGKILGQEVVLFKPLTYMNLSGEAVKAVTESRLEDKKDLLVVSDDAALPFGTVRMREKGSSGGHNGLKSIIALMGNDFARLRMGLGTQKEGEDLASYVLSPFSRAERKEFDDAVGTAVACAETWLEKGVRKAMELYNG